MARVKRGNVARKRRNKVLRLARGFRGSNGSLFRTANQRVMKALCNAYRDRRRRWLFAWRWRRGFQAQSGSRWKGGRTDLAAAGAAGP